jgi:hypothetical protein
MTSQYIAQWSVYWSNGHAQKYAPKKWSAQQRATVQIPSSNDLKASGWHITKRTYGGEGITLYITGPKGKFSNGRADFKAAAADLTNHSMSVDLKMPTDEGNMVMQRALNRMLNNKHSKSEDFVHQVQDVVIATLERFPKMTYYKRKKILNACLDYADTKANTHELYHAIVHQVSFKRTTTTKSQSVKHTKSQSVKRKGVSFKLVKSKPKKIKACEKQSTKKYLSRPSPPYPAVPCFGQTMAGNNGKMWISKQNATGVWQWRRVL